MVEGWPSEGGTAVCDSDATRARFGGACCGGGSGGGIGGVAGDLAGKNLLAIPWLCFRTGDVARLSRVLDTFAIVRDDLRHQEWVGRTLF
jgi:hypothetical protein